MIKTYLTDAELNIVRMALRRTMAEIEKDMRYAREFGKATREEFDAVRNLYIKLGGE